jgi:hypothetical protein
MDNKLLLPFVGTMVGAYQGYCYAIKKRTQSWGPHANKFGLNVGYIGYFGLFGLGIGYCASKIF